MKLQFAFAKHACKEPLHTKTTCFRLWMKQCIFIKHVNYEDYCIYSTFAATTAIIHVTPANIHSLIQTIIFMSTVKLLGLYNAKFLGNPYFSNLRNTIAKMKKLINNQQRVVCGLQINMWKQ